MIGLSIGAMNTSVAYSEVNQNGKLISDIILSETSSRTIPSTIAYSKSHRMIGDHAMLTIRKHMNATFLNINRLIGMKANSEYGKREINHMLTDLQFSETEDGELLYKIFLNQQESFLSTDSLLTGYINKIKNDLIINLHKKECVAITVGLPDFMTVNQTEVVSRALKASEIENFNIINESTAITLYYGYNRYKTLFVEGEKDNQLVINPNAVRYIMFLDLGHSKASFILSEFRPQYFRVVNVETHPFLGGREMDKLIFNHLCGVFYKQTKVDISNNKKSAIKLMEQITRARKVLTANQEVQISIDCLFEDYDFSYMLKRSEFEGLIKPQLDLFSEGLSKFYKNSMNMIDKAVNGIEMAGDCMRIPIIQNLVKEATGKDLQKSVINDEAVSKGCSLYTALVNNVLPLQSFQGVFNYNPYSIVYNFDDTKNSNFLVKRGESIPATKNIEIDLNQQKDKIARIAFFYLKFETEFILNTYDVIMELDINIEELFSVNKLSLKNIPEGKLLLEVMIDNSGKVHFQKIKLTNNNTLTVDMNVLCLNPKLGKVNLHQYTLIKRYADDIKLLENLKKIEKEHFTQDEHIKELHIKKNQLESNVYKLRNKYLEKEKEYEKLYNPQATGTTQTRSVLERLNSVENALQGSSSEGFEIHHLETVDSKVKEIEKFLSRKTSEDKTKKRRSSAYLEFNDRLHYFSGLVDEEYVKILGGKPSRFDQKTVDLISEILSKYRMVLEHSEDKDLRTLRDNFEKEMKKYFK
jgi:molecular chaperone DnaK (HSP70)